MTKGYDPPRIDPELHRLAEEIIRRNEASSKEAVEDVSSEEIRRIFHELRVHQIELEMQNVQLREAQAALETSQARYFDLYDMAPVGYCTVSEKGLILEANLKAATLLGVTRSQLAGQPISPGFIHKEDRGDYYLLHNRLFETGEPQAYELRMVKPDGTVFWVHLSNSLAKDENGSPLCRIVLIDITARKQADDALRQSEKALYEREQRLQLFIEHAPAALAMFDREMRYLSVSRRWLNDYGPRDRDLRGQSLYEVFDLPERWKEAHRRGLAGEVLRVEDDCFERPDGSVRCICWEIRPWLDISGDIGGIVIFTEDVTKRKKVEQQLQTYNDDLERRVEQRTHELKLTQAQMLHSEKLAAIGQLSASIAHEFNNPLQGIMNILKGLKRRAILEDDDKELLDLAISESHRMKNLIRSLQDFNRPSSSKKTLMDVHASIDSLLLLCKSDFKRKRISTVLNYAERLPQIRAVPDQIKQVFLNLLNNAADACQKQSRVITISTWQVEQRVAVAIQDTGVGIKPEKIDLIFQPFYTTKSDVKGTGLGLSVCHGIVQHHQGEIRVESEPEKGSTFTVLLPAV
jgi:PAS domain S-box-containing protein